jgi:mannonate dehydratase
LGEGRYDPAVIMRALKECGYEGIMLDDHVPFLTADTRWGHTARAYTFGYLKGLAKML